MFEVGVTRELGNSTEYPVVVVMPKLNGFQGKMQGIIGLEPTTLRRGNRRDSF